MWVGTVQPRDVSEISYPTLDVILAVLGWRYTGHGGEWFCECRHLECGAPI